MTSTWDRKLSRTVSGLLLASTIAFFIPWFRAWIAGGIDVWTLLGWYLSWGACVILIVANLTREGTAANVTKETAAAALTLSAAFAASDLGALQVTPQLLAEAVNEKTVVVYTWVSAAMLVVGISGALLMRSKPSKARWCALLAAALWLFALRVQANIHVPDALQDDKDQGVSVEMVTPDGIEIVTTYIESAVFYTPNNPFAAFLFIAWLFMMLPERRIPKLTNRQEPSSQTALTGNK